MKSIAKLSLLFFLTVFSSHALDSDSVPLLEELEKSVAKMKEQPLNLDKILRKSVMHYQKSRDKKFLTQALKSYAIILKKNNQHYIVEMFFPLYKKDKKAFGKFLDQALSQKDKIEFLSRMEIVAREEQSGNG